MSALHRALLVAAPLVLSAAAATQTFGVPCINYNHVTFGGVALPPPFVASCPPPIAPPPGALVSLDVETPLPGLPVLYLIAVGPCCPGAVCLPPSTAPVPPCLPPCGPATNQSFDLCGPPTTLLVLSGPKPGTPAGLASVPVVLPGVGIVVSIQAFIFAVPFAPTYLVTNAYSLVV